MAMSGAQISLHEAIEQMSGIPEGERPVEPEDQDQPLTEQAEAESESDIDPEERPLEADEAEEDSEDVDDGESPEEHRDSDEDGEEPETFTVWTGSENVEVDLEELKNGYMLKADHTRKTQEIAEHRKALEAGAAQVAQRLEQIDQELEQFEGLLLGQQPQMPPIDWLQSKPAEYEAQKRQVDEWNAFKSNLDTWRQKIQTERSEAAAKERQELIQKEAGELVRVFKLKDQAEFMAKTGEIQAYLLSNGYNQARLQSMLDHRDYVIADKARKYDELLAKNGSNLKVKKGKVKSASSSAPQKPVSRVKKAKQRLDKVTGSRSGFSRNAQINAVLDDMEA